MRKISLLFFLSMLAINMHAQDLAEQEIQIKEDSIFNIKFSEQAHYAEVVIDMATDDNEAVSLAQQQSIALLQTHVIEVFAKRLKMSNQDVRDIWDVIEDKCQNVEIKSGTLWKVFTYMAKDALKGFLGGKVQNLSPEDSLILFGPKEKKIIIPEKKDTSDTSISPKPAPIKPDTIAKQDTIAKSDTLAKPIPSTPKTDVVIPSFCKQLIKKGNKKALETFLEDGALYNELMFGGFNEMQYISKCYVVIIEKETGKIIGVLDKGESERINFMTQKQDHYRMYDNEKYELIFVQEL